MPDGTTKPGDAAETSDPLWDDWDTPLAASVPVLHLDGFDGPADLLLDLAQRQRIDLGRLSIVRLAEQFAGELEGRLRGAPIERRADWLVLAAQLLQLRSRLLASANPADAAQAQRDAARTLAGLETMQRTRAAAHWLGQRQQLGHDVFARPHDRSPRATSYLALMEACLTVLRGRTAEAAEATATLRIEMSDFWRMADALAHVRAKLEVDPHGGDLTTLVPRLPETPDRTLKLRAAVASTLSACLELARDGELDLQQTGALGAIEVSRVAKAQP